VPSAQQGQVKLRGKNYTARYYDATGRRRRKTFGPGRAGKAEAVRWLAAKIEEVEGLRDPTLGAIRNARRESTLSELVSRYLEQHQAAPATLDRLRFMLAKAEVAFGDVPLRRLLPDEVGAWRTRLPEGHRHDAHQALRQVLRAAVRWKLVDENAAALVPNPLRKRAEVRPFESWEQIEAIAKELGCFGPVVVFAAGTGLRPEEWLALERRDFDREALVIYVRRTFSGGVLREFGKTDRSRRRVPLRERVVGAIDELPPRIDTTLLFPGERGGHLDLHSFRAREWTPALRAAGFYDCPSRSRTMKRVPRGPYRCAPCGFETAARRIYDLRHTYATWSLAAGVSLFTLARRMGTSVEMIDRTYGHLAPDAEDYERDLLDAFDAREVTVAADHGV
jgi:integrase